MAPDDDSAIEAYIALEESVAKLKYNEVVMLTLSNKVPSDNDGAVLTNRVRWLGTKKSGIGCKICAARANDDIIKNRREITKRELCVRYQCVSVLKRSRLVSHGYSNYHISSFARNGMIMLILHMHFF